MLTVVLKAHFVKPGWSRLRLRLCILSFISHPLRKISVNDHFFTTEGIIPLKACEKKYDQTRLPFINVEYNFDTSSF